MTPHELVSGFITEKGIVGPDYRKSLARPFADDSLGSAGAASSRRSVARGMVTVLRDGRRILGERGDDPPRLSKDGRDERRPAHLRRGLHREGGPDGHSHRHTRERLPARQGGHRRPLRGSRRRGRHGHAGLEHDLHPHRRAYQGEERTSSSSPTRCASPEISSMRAASKSSASAASCATASSPSSARRPRALSKAITRTRPSSPASGWTWKREPPTPTSSRPRSESSC